MEGFCGDPLLFAALRPRFEDDVDSGLSTDDVTACRLRPFAFAGCSLVESTFSDSTSSLTRVSAFFSFLDRDGLSVTTKNNEIMLAVGVTSGTQKG